MAGKTIVETKRGFSRRHLLVAGIGTVAIPSLLQSPASLFSATPAEARAVQQQATADDERLMRLALDEARQGDYPFGTVITRNGEVLETGRNLGKEYQDPTAHGEMVAIRRFLARYGPDQLKGCTLYTSGEPCVMCMGAIIWCSIARVVYAASIEQLAAKIGQIMVSSSEIADKTPFETIEITGGVLADEAMKLF